MNYEQLLKLFESRRKGKLYKSLSATKQLYMNTDKSLSVQLHQTKIVTVYPNDDVIVNTGGWHTRTTHKWISEYGGVWIYSANSGVSSWDYNYHYSISSQERLVVPHPLKKGKVMGLATPYYDGIRFDKDRKVISKRLPYQLEIEDKEISNKAKKAMAPLFELRRLAKALGDEENSYQSKPSVVARKILNNQELNYDEASKLSDHDLDMIRYDVRRGLGNTSYVVELEDIGSGQYRWNRVE